MSLMARTMYEWRGDVMGIVVRRWQQKAHPKVHASPGLEAAGARGGASKVTEAVRSPKVAELEKIEAL